MKKAYSIYNTCCFTGHRPSGFVWDYEDKDYALHKDYLLRLEYFIEHAIIHNQTQRFICGSALGADADCAETIIRLRKKYPYIKLQIAEAYEKYGENYAPKNKARYLAIMAHADSVYNACKQFTPWCTARRNQYMVDNADMLIAIWNGEEKGGTFNTVKYALKKGLPIRYLGLPPLKPSTQLAKPHYFSAHLLSYAEQKAKDEQT